ncbi:LamG-like jellyroll fold domain-containing protein, partial [Flavisericum labens]|uniref:LamG-like jellyroll fold domain-containing protein n=1 Tax=Flavisericum labens TaxID=3377112 RepID=UPI00387B8E9F
IDTAASDQTVECDGAGNGAALTAWLNSNGGAVASDTCGNVTWSNNFTALSDLCGGTGSATVTFTATDDCGRTATTQATFTIEDTTDPSIDTPSSDQTVECDGAGNGAALTAWLSSNGGAAASDTCGNVSWSNNFTALSDLCGGTGAATVTFNATDDCGRTATAQATFTIEDTTPPVISGVGPDTTIECTETPVFSSPTASDACDGLPSLVFIDVTTPDASHPDEYSVTRTWTATDACGNSSQESQTITVLDTTPPDTIVISTETRQCSFTVNAPTTTDNCAGTITGTNGDYDWPHTFNSDGTYVISWLFDDGNGNSITVDQTVIINDTIPPVPDIANLPDINVVDCEVDVVTPTATDNCRGTINGDPTDANGNDIDFPITTFGTTIITWTYDDRNGQIVTQQQNVTLTKPPISGGVLLGRVDDLDPVEFPPTNNVAISACPDDINPVTINLSGENGTIVHWEKFEAGDNNWDIIPSTSGLNTYNIDFDFANTKSTVFRVLIQWGTCEEYSQIMSVHAVPPDVPPTLENDYFNTCLGTEISLVAYSGYGGILIDPDEEEAGQFDQGQFPDKWNPNMWKIDGQVAGVAFTGAANNRSVNNWTATNNHPFPDGTWSPKIEYDSNNFKFAIAQGDFTSQEYIDEFPPGNATTLETPILSLLGLESPSISFTTAWNLDDPTDIALFEMSLDGGLTYNVLLQDIWDIPGVIPDGEWPYTSDPGSSQFNYVFDTYQLTFPLDLYTSYDQVRFRWTYFGNSPFSAWAIDEITLPLGGSPANEIEWTDGIGDPNEDPLADGTLSVAYTFTPDAPGAHQYGATILVNGCRAYDPDGTALADVLVNYAYAGEDILYAPGECGENVITLNAYDNTKNAIDNATKGAFTLPLDCKNCGDPGTGTPGKWTVDLDNSSFDCGSSYSFSDDEDPNATFTGDPGTYRLLWTVGPWGPNNEFSCVDDVIVEITNCAIVDFDGENDNVTFGDNYNLNPAFSVECWIKPDATTNTGGTNNAIQTIISKRNANSSDYNKKGYDLRLVNNIVSFRWNESGSITSAFPIGTNRWYHVAITRTPTNGNSGIYRMYIDGIQVSSNSGSAPNTNANDFILGAMAQTGNPPNKPVNYFSGWIDEVRIWNKTLSVHHIRQMMNQEIKQLGSDVGGEVIPTKIYGVDTNQDGVEEDLLTWANLDGYYRMDQIACGYLEPYGGVGVDGKLRHITSQQEPSAPLPYTTKSGGNWYDITPATPWTYSDTVWDYPNALGIDNTTRIDWNIVKTSHIIESDLTSASPRNITLLGLVVDPSSDLTITAQGTQDETNTGHGLWITHYLKLDGFMDLVGESQLVQKRYNTSGNPTVQFNESILDVTSAGYIFRSQQGSINLFNYNYWSSPTSPVNTTDNNLPFYIKWQHRDGTVSSTPKVINWLSSGYNASATSSPISIPEYWLWSYENFASNTYAKWVKLSSTTAIKTGLGYTMKGSGAGGSYQNYVFVGKPHNNTINSPITIGNDALIGNPYPSAIDADEFIKDNIPALNPGGTPTPANPETTGSIDGSLYFWIHFDSNNTHVLRDYEGGYATYTLAGGNAPVTGVKYTTTDGFEVSGNGSSILRPGQYIPVAQGFFVHSAFPDDKDEDFLKFQNSQRIFERETNDNTNDGSQFLKTSNSKSAKNSSEPIIDETVIKRIRFQFKSAEGTNRPLLLAFTPNNEASDGFDYGYDAKAFETLPSDMLFMISDEKYVIQGVGEFDKAKQYPIAITINETGPVQISLAGLENFDSYKNVYVYDSFLDTYTKINNKSFNIYLDAGDYSNRFFIAFTKAQNNTLDLEDFEIENAVVNYLNKSNQIYIHVPNTIEVEQVYITNLIGQTVKSWNRPEMFSISGGEFKIPVKTISEGPYVIIVETKQAVFRKNVIITNKF